MLEEYHRISKNEKLARFKVIKKISVDIEGNETLSKLWEIHENALKKLKTGRTDEEVKFSLLDLKILIAEKLFRSCCFCERRCKVDRTKETGFCGVKEPRVASEFMHIGEEQPLIPSHTIFFSGCTFRCVFCQNWDISQFPEAGVVISPKKLAKIIDRKRQLGSKNVNFVGGDPTPNLNYILKVMKYCRENIPVIWNSNMYLTVESMKLLDGFVDLYLTDFKFGNDDCAKKLANVDNYWEVITRNHLLAEKSGDVIIRHLVLPGHVECCTEPIIEWIAENMEKAVVNIMGQYRPVYKANKYPEIARYPTSEEIYKARKLAEKEGLELLP
ncbi:Radical SAM domain protein [Methanothermus fervidus DSM 2088]|uniref:Radical SAM domain protein n=1 Tax=Methanothermus fervidus (strain ATCC 43054 / DSM 2088 / JCM 10308 / V24 S) TaxID=523846 RepID=E3GWG8_METFV|nr:radical SAM protein [Methanothermus fervidus]ADP77933.1 Radical SAM domain protein [Methanothermus fervidus DSM 2088]